MITLNVVGENISISVGEDTYALPYDKDVYNSLDELSFNANNAVTVEEYNQAVEHIVEFINENLVSLDKLIASECDYLKKNPLTGEYYLMYNDEVVSDIPLPKSLVQRILDSIDKGVSFLPVVKLWTRFLRNPHLKSKGRDFADRFAEFVNMKYIHPQMFDKYIEQGLHESKAAELSTIYQIKITNEGLLNGYKVSREILHKYDAETGEEVPRYTRTFNVNTGEIESEGIPEHVEDRLFQPAVMGNSGDAFYCGEDKGHFIRVGKVHALESWDQVNCNDNDVCVKGLHVGGLYYINFYSGEIHNIFVDPMHIGAIPDSTDGAIRCKEYFVHSSLAGVNGSMYHSSTYAEMTDAQWEEMRKEALELNSAAKKDINAEKELLKVM